MLRRALLLVALALASSCFDDNTPRCSPDTETSDCLCRNGRMGSRRCRADGLGHGEFVCPPEDGGAGDAATGEDAGADTPGADAATDVPGADAPADALDGADAADVVADTGAVTDTAAPGPDADGGAD